MLAEKRLLLVFAVFTALLLVAAPVGAAPEPLDLAEAVELIESAGGPEDHPDANAVVIFDRVEFDTAMARGLDMYLFKVVLVLGRVNTRGTEEALDGYLSGNGSTSLKAAIESDRSLGGEIQVLRVTSGENVRELVVADITYVAADFLITVYA
jgi:hypothetical protein